MNSRLTASHVLFKVIKEGQSLTVALDNTLESIENSMDRAFIQALCYGVIRQYQRLDFVLHQLLKKPLRAKDTDITMLLLLGLYQIKHMRVKPHAAVSETVNAVKKKSWAKSLINGVLRQYIREQEKLENQAEQQTNTLHSHPNWLIKHFEKDWPEHITEILIANNQPPPMVLRVNLQKTSQQAYLILLAEHSINATAIDFCSSALVLDQSIAVEKLPGFERGLVSIQDTAAQLAAQLLEVQTGQSVLDLCAAPGGKTAAILERHGKSISLLAVDIDENRLLRIKDNIARLELQAKILAGDAEKPAEWANNQMFDRILVDTPCSAIGVIRRHPDIKLLRRESDISTLLTTQRKILQAAWELLMPGGILLYATCSVLKQENEEQIQAFLAHQKDASEILINADWGIKRPAGRQILTGDSGMDGFYYAKLIKSALT